ncbi:MAG TPA: patatin-like phospholipase family protein [Gemmatimonadaceae bacterium]|nr:patatin-like phospholipase family protein [Gemmatimonadaceae bacterium]
METTQEVPPEDNLALMLGGGGARGAYQAGVLRGIAERFPDLNFPILAGISAGAVNTIHLAAHQGPLRKSADQLIELWLRLSPEAVYDVRSGPLMWNAFNWGARLLSGGIGRGREPMRGMVETNPLRKYLESVLDRAPDGSIPGIQRNIDRGLLKAVALSATSYATGQSVTWIEGRDIELWQRPQRRTEPAKLTVEHVMASSALPMLFPAVKVGTEWFGDGGVRLTAPLSPALHLGATRILTISTKYQKTRTEADTPATAGYPPPAQVLGVLYNSVFLDLIDEDILRLRKVNQLLKNTPPEKREKMRVVDIMVLRPSQDLGRMARSFEPKLPPFFRYLTRGLGTTKTASPDLISLILFQNDYLKALIDLGEKDALAHGDAIKRFLERPVMEAV